MNQPARAIRFAFAAAILLVLGGCQLVGALVAKSQGPEKVKAAYVPPKVMTLILSEHPAGAGVDDVSSEDIGRRVAEFWGDLKLSPLVDLSKLEELHLQRPEEYDKMSVAAIGRAMGAENVLYIDVRDSHDESAGGSDTIRATATARVKMVDVATGRTLWPLDAAEGYTVDAQTQYQARGEGVSESTQMQEVRGAIANKIIKLFYDHVSEDDVAQ